MLIQELRKKWRNISDLKITSFAKKKKKNRGVGLMERRTDILKFLSHRQFQSQKRFFLAEKIFEKTARISMEPILDEIIFFFFVKFDGDSRKYISTEMEEGSRFMALKKLKGTIDYVRE